MGNVPALLGWWETSARASNAPVEVLAPAPEPIAEPIREPIAEPVAKPRPAGTNMYSAIMARGPVLGRSSTAAQANARPSAVLAQAPARPPAPQQAAAPAPPFGKPAQPSPENSNWRVDPAQQRSQQQEPQLRSCNARLLDISQTGLSLLSDVAPARDQALWVRLEGSQPTEWVEVEARGVSPREHGKYLVRVAFPRSCPYDFFKAAVYRPQGA